MTISHPYCPRPIRFLEVYPYNAWSIKIYSISVRGEFADAAVVDSVKTHLGDWLQNAQNYPLDIYGIATLIIHEAKEGIFALISWWIDENMLQHHAYFSPYAQPLNFSSYSDKGIIACVWELAVLCFERQAWIDCVLKKAPNPDVNNYLSRQCNMDV